MLNGMGNESKDMNHASAAEMVTALASLAATQNLRGRAFEGCSKWLNDAAGGGLGGWAVGEIVPHFKSCSLVFDHGLLAYPFVETRLELCVREASGIFLRDLRPIGYYRLITLLDGTPDDDYFVIVVPKPTDG